MDAWRLSIQDKYWKRFSNSSCGCQNKPKKVEIKENDQYMESMCEYGNFVDILDNLDVESIYNWFVDLSDTTKIYTNKLCDHHVSPKMEI